MADAPTDIRTLIRGRGADPDRAAVAHVVASTGFLALGSILAGVALITMTFPGFLPLGYGIFRALAMASLSIGFFTLSIVGGTYYVLPRLTGAQLWNEQVARGGLAIVAGVTVVGMVVVAAGLGDGREPFAFPWWIDLPLVVGLAVPAVVAVQTVRHRIEHRSYVTVPYVVTALVALPILYVVGNIPGTTVVSATLADLFFSSAFLVAVAILGGVGLAYYAVVKQGDHPLAGRQLAQVAFWSLTFGAGWFGVVQLVGGPVPTWLPVIAAVLGLGFPAGTLATSANLLTTVEGSWGTHEGSSPVVSTAVAGVVFASVVALLAAVASFRAAATLLALTVYWEGIVYGLVLGAVPLILAAWTYQALPRMTGRRLYSSDLVARQLRLTVGGAGAMLGLFVVAGVVTGYGWAGGGFTGAYTAVGEGWSAASGPGMVLAGIGTLAGLVAVAGNLVFASSVFRTITQGAATTQEVLVAAQRRDEAP